MRLLEAKKYRSPAKVEEDYRNGLLSALGTRDELRRGMMSQMKDRAIFTIVFE